MRIKNYLLLTAMIWVCFTGLFFSCTTIGKNKQEPRFLNDTRENYQDATNRNVEMDDEPWSIKHVYESWEDIYVARLFEYNGSDFLVVAYGDYNSGYYMECCILEKEAEYNHFIGSEINLKWSMLDNFRNVDDRVYFYTADDLVYYFSLDSFNLTKVDEYPFEKIDQVNAVISPDRKLQVFWFNNTICLKNLETGQNEILWDDPGFDGSWSVGDIVWSHDSKRLYFDNSGGAACIWEIDLEENTLKKIVTDHGAIHPFYFSRNGYDYILYVEEYSVRIATNDPDADGYIRQEFIESGSLKLPLEVLTDTTISMLEMMPFRSIDMVASDQVVSGDMGGESTASLWRVGTMMDDPYKGGILYREEYMFFDKGGSEYNITRYIKLNDRLIILPRSSSLKYYYYGNNGYYERSLNQPLTFSLLFSDCNNIIIDYSVAVEGIYIPDTLAYIPGYYRIDLVEERLIDRSSEPLYVRISQPEDLMAQLVEVYEDDHGMKVYMEKGQDGADQHEALKYRKGGLFAFTSDESVLVYQLIPEFTGTIPLDQSIDLNDYSHVSDWGYIAEGGGPLDIALVYSKEKLFGTELQILGHNSHGDTLWGTMETEHPVLINEYERVRENSETFEVVNQYVPTKYRDFIEYVPLFYWKDPFGRYIRFISIDYITPMLSEPIIYLYDDTKRIFSIGLDKKVRIAASYPEINSRWEVYGTEDGKVILSASGEKYDYLFWEGFAGLIPSGEEGFTVERDELPEFFDKALKKLGLVQLEIEDFKTAWLPEMSDAPWYFISFYDQDLIDLIAPLDLDPKPETVIRILMDYKPLFSVPVRTIESKLGKTPDRKGSTLVEWGGLRRR